MLKKISPALRSAQRQLEEYFVGQRTKFNLKFVPTDLLFQHKVWNILQTIPYGETWNYQQLARVLPMLKSHMYFIPCHCVILATGEPENHVGGANITVSLLELEQQQ